MKCRAVEELLTDYYYQELDPKALKLVAGHLASCSSCAKAYCRLHACLAGVPDLLEEAPSREVHDELREKVAKRFARPLIGRVLRMVRFPIPAYQTVLMVLVLFLLGFFLSPILSGRRPRPLDGTFPAVSGAKGAYERKAIVKDYDGSVILMLDPRLL